MTDRLYTQRQIRDTLISLGASYEQNPSNPPKEADILAAIAMAETPVFSSPGYSNYDRWGDLDKVGQTAGGGKTYGPSVTSFQIRTLREDTGSGSKRDLNFLLERLRNGCQSALEIARTSGYQAWATYTGGHYKAYLPDFFPPPDGEYYVVSGDTLYRIDEKLGLPRGQMLQWNPTVNPNKLRSGQALKLGYVERTVRPGDNFLFLMKTAGYKVPISTTSEDFLRAAAYARRSPPEYLIYPGQVLRILKPGWSHL